MGRDFSHTKIDMETGEGRAVTQVMVSLKVKQQHQ
jgi:hypothetical protein